MQWLHLSGVAHATASLLSFCFSCRGLGNKAYALRWACALERLVCQHELGGSPLLLIQLQNISVTNNTLWGIEAAAGSTCFDLQSGGLAVLQGDLEE